MLFRAVGVREVSLFALKDHRQKEFSTVTIHLVGINADLPRCSPDAILPANFSEFSFRPWLE
jgi:hypothetical protein